MSIQILTLLCRSNTDGLHLVRVQRRGSADKGNKHTHQGGHTVDKIAARSADPR